MTSLFKKPKVTQVVSPPSPPAAPPPTIDEAALRDENFRKFARRKGHLANVRRRSGSSAAAPSVAVKQLLG